MKKVIAALAAAAALGSVLSISLPTAASPACVITSKSLTRQADGRYAYQGNFRGIGITVRLLKNNHQLAVWGLSNPRINEGWRIREVVITEESEPQPGIGTALRVSRRAPYVPWYRTQDPVSTFHIERVQVTVRRCIS